MSVASAVRQIAPGEVFASVRYTVEAGHIGAFADGLQDPNPLWRDIAYAAEHGYRGLPAPPTFSEALNPLNGMSEYPVDFGMPHDFSAGNRYRNFHPLIAGDVVDVDVSLHRIVETARGEGTARLVRVEYLREVMRADGVLVADTLWTHAHFEGEPARNSDKKWTAPDNWSLAGTATLTIDRVGLAKWGCAINDLHPIHFDLPYARSAMGFHDVVADGWRSAALVGQVITQWAGPIALVDEIVIRYLGFTYPGDDLVAEVWIDPDQAGMGSSCRVEATVTNQKGALVARGTALVTRPAEGSMQKGLHR